jgi:hypothetical protein
MPPVTRPSLVLGCRWWLCWPWRGRSFAAKDKSHLIWSQACQFSRTLRDLSSKHRIRSSNLPRCQVPVKCPGCPTFRSICRAEERLSRLNPTGPCMAQSLMGSKLVGSSPVVPAVSAGPSECFAAVTLFVVRPAPSVITSDSDNTPGMYPARSGDRLGYPKVFQMG